MIWVTWHVSWVLLNHIRHWCWTRNSTYTEGLKGKTKLLNTKECIYTERERERVSNSLQRAPRPMLFFSYLPFGAGWMNGGMDSQLDRQESGWRSGRIDRKIDRQMDGRTDGQQHQNGAKRIISVEERKLLTKRHNHTGTACYLPQGDKSLKLFTITHTKKTKTKWKHAQQLLVFQSSRRSSRFSEKCDLLKWTVGKKSVKNNSRFPDNSSSPSSSRASTLSQLSRS